MDTKKKFQISYIVSYMLYIFVSIYYTIKFGETTRMYVWLSVLVLLTVIVFKFNKTTMLCYSLIVLFVFTLFDNENNVVAMFLFIVGFSIIATVIVHCVVRKQILILEKNKENYMMLLNSLHVFKYVSILATILSIYNLDFYSLYSFYCFGFSLLTFGVYKILKY